MDLTFNQGNEVCVLVDSSGLADKKHIDSYTWIVKDANTEWSFLTCVKHEMAITSIVLYIAWEHIGRYTKLQISSIVVGSYTFCCKLAIF